MVSQNGAGRGLIRGARCAAALLALAGADASAAGGFGFCAPPLKPACVDAPAATAGCDDEVQAFVKTVFLYRACLEKETERAVREANQAIESWKCRKSALACR